MGYLCTESFTPICPSAGCSKGRSLAALPTHLLCLGQSPSWGFTNSTGCPLGGLLGRLFQREFSCPFKVGLMALKSLLVTGEEIFLTFRNSIISYSFFPKNYCGVLSVCRAPCQALSLSRHVRTGCRGVTGGSQTLAVLQLAGA